MAWCNKCSNNNRCNSSCGKRSITRQIRINNNSIGRDGESAYDQWVRLITTIGLDDPHNPGQSWPIDETSVDDYIYYNRGEDGVDGLSAYDIAVDNGFVGTEEQWLASLQGSDGADGTIPEYEYTEW